MSNDLEVFGEEQISSRSNEKGRKVRRKERMKCAENCIQKQTKKYDRMCRQEKCIELKSFFVFFVRFVKEGI
jgi:hypothetical protein